MKKHPTITISFLQNDNELWEYIQSKKDYLKMSTYIRDLIRKDMLNEVQPKVINEDRIIQQILLALNQQDNVTGNDVVSEIAFIDEEAKNTILNLFN